MPQETANRPVERTVETPVQARQGYLDRPVLIVLIASLVLIVVAFGALWLPTVL